MRRAALTVVMAAALGAGADGLSAEALASILREHPGLERIVESAAEHRLQVVLGLVESPSDGGARLVQRTFRAGDEYFYPASTVKFFAAVAALERLAALRSETGLALSPDTPLVYHPLFEDEEPEVTDPDHRRTGTITVRQQVRELFLVSDNVAFNRLYELVGQDRLHASMAAAGLPDARVVHRLSEVRTPEQNLRSPRIDLVGPNFRLSLEPRVATAPSPAPEIAGLSIGSAYRAGGQRIDEPMDFTAKNRIALSDLQRGLCMVVRPEVDCGGPGYQLDAADRALLLEAMSRYPRQSTDPHYDPAEYPDDYVKFLLPGLARVVDPDRLVIYNKVGQAYGFTTENAYVVDRTTGRAFFLAATLYTNANGVLNDDDYEYDQVALPFLANLGEAVASALWGSAPPRPPVNGR